MLHIMTNKKNIEVKLKRKLKEQSCVLCAYVVGNQNQEGFALRRKL
jgi:hypothetical protein